MLPECPKHTLGGRARGRNLRAGVLFAGVALGTILLSREVQLTGLWRWLVLVPVTLASYRLIASMFGVCAYSGLRGERFADYGRERVLDETIRRQLRLRALLMLSLSVLIAGVIAFVFADHA